MPNPSTKVARKPHRKGKALLRIERGILENTGEKTGHFCQRMIERETTWSELQEAVPNFFIERVERDVYYENLKYRVVGRLKDGSYVTVIVAMDERRASLFFITVFKEAPEGRDRKILALSFNRGRRSRWFILQALGKA